MKAKKPKKHTHNQANKNQPISKEIGPKILSLRK